MKIIAITTPKVIDEDAYIIKSLLDKGIDIVHLRKPESCIDDCRKLLSTLDAEYRASIVIHDYPELYSEFSLRGIHINRNITTLPEGYNGLKTRSCHSLEEIAHYKSDFDYLLLSPIFNSISKAEYRSGFDTETLRRAAESGIIDSKVIALGGVTLDKISYLKSLNFGGGAMVGAIYSAEIADSLQNIDKLK